jgi:AcrR family transcriptional regulator
VTPARTRVGDASGPGRWAGIPADERRAERRRLLLDATLDLLGDGGADAVTVRAVCKAARLNPRYFYESFADRGELLVGLYDDVAAAMGAVVAERLTDPPDDLAEAARIGIDTVFRFVAEDTRRAKVLYTEALGDEALARRRAETIDAFIASLSSSRRGGGAGSRGIDVLTASMFAGGMQEIITGWVGGRIDLTLDELVDAAVALALRVILPTS